MHCPRDNNPLTPKQTNGIQYYVCEVCHGILITKKDLDQFKHRTPKLELPTTPRSSIDIVEGEAVSPLAGGSMEVIEYQGVKIDVCRATGYFWLDGGELDLIIRKLYIKKAKKASDSATTPVSDAIGDAALEGVSQIVIEGIAAILSGIIDL
ncbi:zf-TFIIB domain-containing protein [Rubellicoccus peritrichatus]|uniref:Zf-TFIIB domain-containing protein n=1 Tax=Rubellicoccus peritrichatus TaxID=3080537 RepID=A0AAQ3LD63_9BACT|nr:zf-TFIIB domain-containing protein [Puniceicoccus sp. CR14]WOO41710.1 zf-TFIIB domain-containing protein [Puniceicoccus sp. CR14]